VCGRLRNCDRHQKWRSKLERAERLFQVAQQSVSLGRIRSAAVAFHAAALRDEAASQLDTLIQISSNFKVVDELDALRRGSWL